MHLASFRSVCIGLHNLQIRSEFDANKQVATKPEFEVRLLDANLRALAKSQVDNCWIVSRQTIVDAEINQIA